MTEAQAFESLRVEISEGLAHAEAEKRKQIHGSNRLTTKKGKSPLILFLSQFHDSLIYILLASALITGFLKSWLDATVIFAVVFLNAMIGFIQEFNALRAIDALSRVLSISAAVLRDGLRKVIPAAELVPGDIVFLQSGDKVPADLRLIKLRDLQIDESALTGESVPVEKRTGRLPGSTVLAERSNMAYSSTLVTFGTGIGLVVETGDHTELGRINRLIAEASDLETPLTRKIRQFSRLLMWFILGLALVTFLAGWWREQEAIDSFIAAVALAVAAIPEGLPVAVTITLAIGVARMAKRHAIIRKLPAVETLGSTTVICSDKTGTLTQNQMTVQAIYAAGQAYEVAGSGYEPRGGFSQDGIPVEPRTRPALMECLKAGLLCNDARLAAGNEGWELEGDPTEGALLISAHKAGLDHADQAQAHPRIDAIPFESAHQFMATLHHNQAADAYHVYLKGSVESILQRCDSALDTNLRKTPLDIAAVHARIEAMTANGLRVLAFARGELPQERAALEHAEIAEGLSFLGLQGMIDPPRPEAVLAIAACRTAGIRIKMITGDHLGTAVAIARQIGLVDAGGDIGALEGKALANVPESALPEIAERTAVFARVAPEQKLRLVEALQARGHIVAMTGDGVNDAPALRQANIGVAMGITGTDVTKEAAAMTLTDDNFASIVAAVEEGRGVFSNIKKYLMYLLSSNVGEIGLMAGASLLGLPLPLTAVQVLYVNLATDGLPALALAVDPPEPDLMQRPPRDPRTGIFTRPVLTLTILGGVWSMLVNVSLFVWALGSDRGAAHAVTMTFVSLVLIQFFKAYNFRSDRHSVLVRPFANRWLNLAIAWELAALTAVLYLPVLNVPFGTYPLPLEDWAIVVAAAFTVSPVLEAAKWAERKGWFGSLGS